MPQSGFYHKNLINVMMKIRFTSYSEINGEKFLEEIIDLVMMCGGRVIFSEWNINGSTQTIHGLKLTSPENPKLILLQSDKRSKTKIKEIPCVLTYGTFSFLEKLLEHLKNEIRNNTIRSL